MPAQQAPLTGPCSSGVSIATLRTITVSEPGAIICAESHVSSHHKSCDAVTPWLIGPGDLGNFLDGSAEKAGRDPASIRRVLNGNAAIGQGSAEAQIPGPFGMASPNLSGSTVPLLLRNPESLSPNFRLWDLILPGVKLHMTWDLIPHLAASPIPRGL